MKILLDECLPVDFQHSFPGHDAHTAEWAGLKGKKNGELLRDAELAGYEVLLNSRSRHTSPTESRRPEALDYPDPFTDKSA